MDLRDSRRGYSSNAMGQLLDKTEAMIFVGSIEADAILSSKSSLNEIDL